MESRVVNLSDITNNNSLSAKDYTRPVIKIEECDRCGEEHEIKIKPFSEPVNDYTHWGVCPQLDEPILFKEDDLDLPGKPI